MQTLLGIIAVIVALVLGIKLLIVLLHVTGSLIGITAIVIWIAALMHIAFKAVVDIICGQFSNLGTKIVWFLIVFFTHVVGAILYFLFGRPAGVVRRYV